MGQEAALELEPLVDRERELAELRALAARKRPQLAVLYGRRRVGKTYLLSHAFQHHRAFYFVAADATGAFNRAELLSQLQRELQPDLTPADYPTWRSVFRLFVTLAAEQPLVVILDEFQYLLNDDAIASQLIAVWDREVGGRQLTLVLSGSSISTMESLMANNAPLFGRVTWAAKLSAFDYVDAASMVADRGPVEKALCYGMFGGIPRYLAAIPAGEALDDVAVRTIVSPHGEVSLQLQTLIEQERGIRASGTFRAVLAVVAEGKCVLNEIAQAAGVPNDNALKRTLSILEELELVRREQLFEAPANAPYRYRCSDQAVGFWYRMVQPYRSRLETDDAHAVWRERIQPFLNDYMGHVFETICRQGFARHYRRWRLRAPKRVGRWEGRDRNRRSIEVDFVARLDGGKVVTGEVKWSNEPVTATVHNALQRDLEDLAASGQQWAREALDPNTSGGRIYFSKAGFADSMRRVAKEDKSVRLVDLDELYAAA
ncbi:MAG TPA: ATP-binding protein [Chloroflexota bacterium]|nr:ATP-binding protein [Chloroflexota bacterium]